MRAARDAALHRRARDPADAGARQAAARSRRRRAQGALGPDRVHPEHGVAYNWAGIGDLGGLFGKTIGIIGLGEVGALVAGMARGFGTRVLYANRNRLPAEREEALGVEYAPIGAPAGAVRLRIAARQQHSGKPRTDRRGDLRRR